MTDDSMNTVRVRFAPSPTGYLHIGGARTLLFNWLLARKTGGKLVLRIEDTDRTRHVEDSVQKILDDLRWLRLTWDEGPQVGGDHGPYYQSQRLDLYNQYADQLLESGQAYFALETSEQLDAMREAAKQAGTGFRYERPDPLPTIDEGRAARNSGQPAVVRFKMPSEAIVVEDEILGTVMLESDQLDDLVIQKADGFPTYHFACVVDDELMKITHVLRGQEHLMNTPKHVAIQRALGFATPHYAHLSVIFNMNGSKMSKRDKEKALAKGEQPPEIEVHDFRQAGFLPEALTNFIALLGWNPGDEREIFSLDELTEAFSLDRISKTNARFDRVKLLSFNTDWAPRLSEDRLLEAYKDYLRVSDHSDPSRRLQPARTSDSSDPSRELQLARSGITESPEAGSTFCAADRIPRNFQPTGAAPTDDDFRWMLKVCAGFRTFRQVEEKVRFLFTADDGLEYDPQAVKKVLVKNDGAGYAMLQFLIPKLEALTDWTPQALEQFLESMCEEKATKLGNIAQPIRVAITGSTISPSIHESLAKLGKAATLTRIRCCISSREL